MLSYWQRKLLPCKGNTLFKSFGLWKIAIVFKQCSYLELVFLYSLAILSQEMIRCLNSAVVMIAWFFVLKVFDKVLSQHIFSHNLEICWLCLFLYYCIVIPNFWWWSITWYYICLFDIIIPGKIDSIFIQISLTSRRRKTVYNLNCWNNIIL